MHTLEITVAVIAFVSLCIAGWHEGRTRNHNDPEQ